MWLVHSNAEWYGSDRSLVLLAEALRRQGWEVTVSVPSEGVLAATLRAADFEPLLVDAAPLRARVFGRVRLLRYFTIDLPRSILRVRHLARRFDVVHLNTSILLGGLVGARLAGRPTVLHVRESYVGRERQWRWYCRMIRPFTSRVVATSNDIAEEVSVAGLGDRTLVVHNGLEFSRPPTRSGGCAGGPVVTVGRINEWKGQEVLVDAVALLRDRGCTVPVELAGDAFPGQEHLEVRLRELVARRGVEGQVRFLGYVEDVDGLLDRTSVFVLPSVRPEPFGLALVDAMSRGLACIATNAGGPRDIIDHRRTGLLVPMGDAGALAEALEELWHDRAMRERIGHAAALDVRSRFSIETTAARVADVYRELLG